MKKVLFLLVLVMSFGVNASAQNHFDIKAGIGASNLANCDDNSTQFAWKAGVGYEIRANKLIGIEPSVLIANKGCKAGDNNYNILYAEVPVMCNFHVGAGWVIGAGIYGGFKLDGGKADEELKYFNSEVKSFDAGFRIGVKHDFDNGLFLGLDATMGETKIAKDLFGVKSTIDEDAKNVTASIMIGYSF